MSKKVIKPSQEEIDRFVIENANDDHAWEKSLLVRKPKSGVVLSDNELLLNTSGGFSRRVEGERITTMKVVQKIVGLFQELLNSASQLMQTRSSGGGDLVGGDSGTMPFVSEVYDTVSVDVATEWGMRCLNLLKRVFDVESDYYQSFKETVSSFSSFSNYASVTQALSILKAAKADYENGNLFNTRILVQAEVFDDFLEQAEHLLKNGYYAPAAVIVGSILEDGLRTLCRRNTVAVAVNATIDPMNSGLAKAGVYNTLMQKKITALADIRNKAAHGKWNEFNDKDVDQMITQVRNFLEDFFS